MPPAAGGGGRRRARVQPRFRRRLPGPGVALCLLLAGCGASSEPAAPPIHPDFSITAPELDQVLDRLGPATAAGIRSQRQVFLDLVAQMLAADRSFRVLVDKQHPLPQEYVPTDLVALDNYPITTSRAGHRLSRRILPDLLAMVEAARIDGIELMVSSAYRSFDYQAGLYQRHVDRIGREAADLVSARPGHSQHQLGTAVDFGSISDGYGETANGRWVARHAGRFGFSLSYPRGATERTGYNYEPWHFRYIGRVGTRLEHEFFGGQQQLLLEFLAAWEPWFAERRGAAGR